MIEEFADPRPGCLDGSLGGFAEQGLELGEDLLDGIEIQGTPPASTRSECFTQPAYRERWVCPILA